MRYRGAGEDNLHEAGDIALGPEVDGSPGAAAPEDVPDRVADPTTGHERQQD